MSQAEPIEEQILAAMVARMTRLERWLVTPWYVPRFVSRTYRPLDAVNELPGYLVLRAPEQSGAERQTIDDPKSAVIASMGVEVVAYGAGSEVEPADRVLIRLLAQAESVLVQPRLLEDAFDDAELDVQNTRQVLDYETEVGSPWRALMSHLYRVRYFYTRGAP
jgi:hypothetical protein